MSDKFYTTEQAAERLGVSRRRVLALIKEGRLVATMMGRDWMIVEADLEAFAKLPREVGWPKGRKKGGLDR